MRTKAGIVAAMAVLALAPGAAQAATPMKGAEYGGQTSQGELVSFAISSNGKRVIDLATSLTYRCTGDHDGEAGSFVLDTIKVKNGRFTSKQTLFGTSEESVVQDGVGTATGTFKRKGRRASGRIRSKLTLRSGETCDSGTVTFSVELL
ncbi:MAG: hypothetical protein M3340_02025 [Actinomycetota bacterium]|nr:hypothetical protein [Actinomycetota bacterium]